MRRLTRRSLPHLPAPAPQRRDGPPPTVVLRVDAVHLTPAGATLDTTPLPCHDPGQLPTCERPLLVLHPTAPGVLNAAAYLPGHPTIPAARWTGIPADAYAAATAPFLAHLPGATVHHWHPDTTPPWQPNRLATAALAWLLNA